MTPRARILALWLCCLAAAAAVVARAHYITDLSAFLPANPTPAQKLLVDQLRDGPASRLILVAIEQDGAATRRRVSAELASRLRQDPQFGSVNNGEPVTEARDRDFLLRHRYLLSDQVSAERFAPPGLRAAIEDTVESLASPAGLMLKSLLPNDPTGEMLHNLEQLVRTPSPTSRDGVWVSPDGARALAVMQTRASGSDTDAQARAILAIRQAFAAAAHGSNVRLRLSGPGVFAVAAREKIKSAATRLSIASSILVVTLLLVVYRSLTAVALGLLPVATGATVGIAAVALGFGAVHGITLGFGITLIGESVDYSIYFFVQSQRAGSGGTALEWQRRWWPTIRLGMLTSVCGFASLLPSGFPGLAQLGLYSISGLVASALVTRFLLPVLLPRRFAIRNVARVGIAFAGVLAPVRRSPPLAAALGATLAVSAVIVLGLHHDRLWNRELAALSPVAAEDQRYDIQLRSDLGAADVRDVVVVSGDSLESVLQGSERAAAPLQSMIDAHLIGGFDSPAHYLPSLALQSTRRSALPDPPLLRQRLDRMSADLPIRAEMLAPFLADVEAARTGPLVAAADLAGTSLGTGFESMILHQKNRWYALMPLYTPVPGRDIDTARVAAGLAGAPLQNTQVLDLKQESDALYGSYLSEAIHLSLAGLAALVVLLLAALRSINRAARILAPLLLSVLAVAAGLAACGVELTILHLVGMLLIVAVGSNYALFFDHQSSLRESGSEPLTLASLAIANASTVIAFGLLSFSKVPVLVALGTTVAPGTFLALLFAAALARHE